VSETANRIMALREWVCSSCSRCCGPSPCRARRPGARSWASAALSTALAYVIYFRVLATAGCNQPHPGERDHARASMLGERLGLRDFLGMALIGLGLVTIDGRALTLRHGLRPRSSGNRRGFHEASVSVATARPKLRSHLCRDRLGSCARRSRPCRHAVSGHARMPPNAPPWHASTGACGVRSRMSCSGTASARASTSFSPIRLPAVVADARGRLPRSRGLPTPGKSISARPASTRRRFAFTGSARPRQTRPTPLLLTYGARRLQPLHQDLYGDLYFPIQMVVLLSEPGRDFTAASSCSRAQAAHAVARRGRAAAPRRCLPVRVKSPPGQGTRGY